MAQLLTGTRIYGTGTVDTQLFVNGTNSATSTTTGALQVVGGVGIGGKLYVGDTINGNLAGGSTGAIVYQSSTNTTAFLSIGSNGQILQSNGSAPVWIPLSGVSAGSATTATHLSGGVAGQIPYQTAPGVTAFLSTGTAGDVLVSNGSSAPTYNNTLTLRGTTAATSTATGALVVAGGVGIGQSLFVQENIVQVGETHSTLATTYNLINTTATTVNFAGAATSLNVGATSGSTNVRNNLTVSGNLTVQGTTTIVDSTVTNIADPILTLGGGTGNSAPTADDNKDRGVAFKWVNNGGTTSTGFFGYDDSTGYFTYVQTATITNEVVSGTKGAMDVNLAGGTAMSIVYQSSQDNTAFLAATTSGYLLQTNGTGSAPSWVNASGVSAGSATYADNVRTIAQAASASYYPTFVDSNNASNAYESVYTTSSFYINPATGAVNVTGTITASSSVTASGTGASGGFRLHTNSGITASNNYMNFFTGQTTGWSFNANGTGADTNQVAYITASGGAYFAGNVGIGTTSTGAKLDVQAGDGGDSRSIQSVLPGSGSYNPAVSNTPGKVVSGIKFNWYSDNWQIGAARSGATSVDGFVISRNNTSTVVITANGALAFGLPTSYGSSGQILQSNGDATPTWVSPGGITGVNADQVRTVAQTASATYYPTFVDSNNASNAYELVYTTSSFSINPSTGLITHAKTTVLGSSIAQGDPSATDITANATLLLSGVGGNYLSFGQKASNLAQWIQSGYSNPTTAVYPISLNPLGGNVGVGTLSPGARLEVYDSNNSTTVTAGIRVTNASITTNSAAGIAFVNYDNYGAWIRSLRSGSSAGILTFGTNNGVGVGEANVIERVRIDSVGTVGIGETSPITYATSGSLVITNTTFRPELALRTTTAVGGTTAIKLGATSSIPQGGAVISSYISAVSGQPTDLIFSLVTSGVLTERLRITSNGGIAFSGSTNYGSAGQMLQSNGDAAPTWVALSSRTVGTSTQVNTVLQTASASYYPTFVDSNNAAAAAESFYTTSSFSINPGTGVVTIAAPAGGDVPSLRITQGTAPSTFNWVSSFLNSSLTSGKNLISLIGQAESGNNSAYFGFKYIGASSASNFATIGLYGADNLLNVLANGNVGIGNSSPGYKLEVTTAGGGYATAVALQSDIGGSIAITSNSSGATSRVGLIFRGSDNIGSAISSAREDTGATWKTYMAFYTNNLTGSNVLGLQEKMRITSGGGISFGASGTAYGTSGQVLQSNGDAAPTWVNQSSIAAGSAPLTSTYVGYGSGSNLLTGSSSLTWNGTTLYVNGNINAVQGQTASFNASAISILGSPNQGTYAGYLLLAKAYISGFQATSMVEGEFVLKRGGVSSGNRTDRYRVSSCSGYQSEGFVVQVTSGSGVGDHFFVSTVKVTYSGTVYHAIKTTTTGGLPDNGVIFFGSSSNAGMLYVDATYVSSELSFGNYTFLTSAGNLGIGTTSPSGKLHLYQTVGGSNMLTLDTNFASGNAYAINPFITSVSNGGFSIRDVTNSVERLVIQYSTGNVGIGTTNPPNKLTVSNGGAVGLEIQPTGGYTALGGVDLLAYNRNSSVYAPIGFITNSSNNSMVILTSGNVGIATVAPSAKLHVSGNAIITGNAVIGATTTTNKFEVAGTAGQLFSVSDSFTGTIFSANDVSGIPSIEVLDTGLVKFAQYNGQVAINTGTVASSTASLSVYGMIQTMGTLGEIRASSEITAYFSSDRRLKENIKLIENPITIIDQIRGVTFDWTDEHMARRGGEDGYFVRKHDIGVIAQEVQAVLPELVGTREDGYLAVKYEKLVPLLIEAIKEQQKTIDALVKDLDNVKEFINNFKNGI